MAKLGDVRKGSYRPFEMEDEQYVDVRELVGKEIVILEAETYVNNKGEDGVYIRFTCPVFDGERFTATKAKGIVAAMKDEGVVEALKTDTIECKVKKRPSRDDSSKTCIVLE